MKVLIWSWEWILQPFLKGMWLGFLIGIPISLLIVGLDYFNLFNIWDHIDVVEFIKGN